MAIINTISIQSKLNKAVASRKFEGLARSAANTRLVFAKDGLMDDIDKSIVTEDIIEACENPSITQKDIISKGNIAAALGFNKGAEPIEDLKEVLNQNIKMDDRAKISIDSNKVNFAFKVNVPSKAFIYQELAAKKTGVEKWTNRSWLDMVENGITYLARFIFWSEGFGDKSGSRSGTGLQVKEGEKVQNKADFTPQKNYLNDIFVKFKERFSK